jgi:hypothetical protein
MEGHTVMPRIESREAALARMRELRGEFAAMPEADRNAPDFAERRAALLNEVHDLDAYLTAARAEDMQRTGPLAALGQIGGVRSLGQALFDSPEFTSWVASGCHGQSPAIQTANELRAMTSPETRALLTEYDTGGPGNASTDNVTSWLPIGQPIPPRARQGRFVLRDLLNVVRTTLPTIPYIRELNPVSLEGGASAVAEGGTKPDVSVNFEPANAPVTTIAANISVTRQLFDDSPAVIQYVNQRLPYLVRVREDAEILNGDGTWPNITGINTVSGTQTQTATSGEYAITIGNAMAKVELADGDATAVVMYPTDAWSMFTKRAAGGSGTFDAGNPFGPTAMTVWGRPVYTTRFATSGQAIVADWANAMTLWDRMDASTVVYAQHSDYPIKNKLLIQCEERIAISHERPDLVVITTLS